LDAGIKAWSVGGWEMLGPAPAITPDVSGFLVAAVVLVCSLCLRNRRGRPLVSVAAMLFSKALYAFAQGFDQFHFGVVIALRSFRREAAAAWRNAEEDR
jgi:hypothetical protein